MTCRVMFSQPMQNLTYKQITRQKYETAERLNLKIKKKLRTESFVIMNTIVKDREKKTELECFSESIGFMAKADLLVMCTGWEKSRGCRLEHEIAKEYGLRILYDDYDNSK